jgi:hypothetical protein
LSIPWAYLASVLGIAFITAVAAVKGAQAETRVPAVQRMREL